MGFWAEKDNAVVNKSINKDCDELICLLVSILKNNYKK